MEFRRLLFRSLNGSPSNIGSRRAGNSVCKSLQGQISKQNRPKRNGLLGDGCRTCQKGWRKGEERSNEIAARNQRLNSRCRTVEPFRNLGILFVLPVVCDVP